MAYKEISLGQMSKKCSGSLQPLSHCNATIDGLPEFDLLVNRLWISNINEKKNKLICHSHRNMVTTKFHQLMQFSEKCLYSEHTETPRKQKEIRSVTFSDSKTQLLNKGPYTPYLLPTCKQCNNKIKVQATPKVKQKQKLRNFF